MSPQRRIMGLKGAAKVTRKTDPRVPDRVRSLLRRLMTPGGPPLDLSEWEVLHAWTTARRKSMGGKRETP